MRINIYRGQVDTNDATINANDAKNDIGGVENGVSNAGNGVNRNESGTNGGKVPLNKEQIQLENLLQIIEKNPSATQAYYDGRNGCIKKNVFLECSLLYRKKVDWYRTEQREKQNGKL